MDCCRRFLQVHQSDLHVTVTCSGPSSRSPPITGGSPADQLGAPVTVGVHREVAKGDVAPGDRSPPSARNRFAPETPVLQPVRPEVFVPERGPDKVRQTAAVQIRQIHRLRAACEGAPLPELAGDVLELGQRVLRRLEQLIPVTGTRLVIANLGERVGATIRVDVEGLNRRRQPRVPRLGEPVAFGSPPSVCRAGNLGVGSSYDGRMLSAVSGAGGFELNGEERGRLVALWRGGSSRRAVRARIVLALAEPAAAPARVAADVGVSVATVDKWRKRFEASGVDGLIDAERDGTPEGRVWCCPTPSVPSCCGGRGGRSRRRRWRCGRGSCWRCAAAGATNKQVAARSAGDRRTRWPSGVRRFIGQAVGRAWSTSRGRAGRRRSCWTRSRK